MSCSSGNRDTDPKSGEFVLAYEGHGWIWKICLNDIPIVWNEPSGGQLPITLAVRNGSNILSVKAVKRSHGPVSPLGLEVRRDVLRTSSTVAALHVSPENVADKYERDITFTASIPITWTWQTADPVSTISEADHDTIVSLIAALKASLAEKDLRKYRELRRIYFADMAKYRGTVAKETSRFEELQLPLFFEGPIQVEMRRPEELSFVTRSRVVYVCGPSDRWLIKLVPSAANTMTTRPTGTTSVSWTFGPFLFAKVQGEWVFLN